MVLLQGKGGGPATGETGEGLMFTAVCAHHSLRSPEAESSLTYCNKVANPDLNQGLCVPQSLPVSPIYILPVLQVRKPNTQLALSYTGKPSTFMTINTVPS